MVVTDSRLLCDECVDDLKDSEHYSTSNFDDLPMIQVPAVKLTDDEIEFASDMAYLKALVDAIVDLRIAQRFAC